MVLDARKTKRMGWGASKHLKDGTSYPGHMTWQRHHQMRKNACAMSDVSSYEAINPSWLTIL